MKELFNELMDNSLVTTTIFYVCFTSFFGLLVVWAERQNRKHKKVYPDNKDAIKEELEKIEQNLIQTRDLLKKLEKDYGNG
jgi:hypothetical protein